jgi:hypothetical protein
MDINMEKTIKSTIFVKVLRNKKRHQLTKLGAVIADIN